jgi:hypothetical protein
MSKKVGDKIGDYEIMEISYKPVYKMRKRITIKNNVWNKEYREKKGWMYIHDGYHWIELDDYPNKQLKFRDIELEY